MELWHLSEQDFFADLPTEKHEFVSLATRREIRRNGVVFSEGEPGDYCYYLVSGSVKVFRTTVHGKEPIFSIRKPGDLFGLAEVIDGKERICTAQALVRSILYEIHRRDFEELLARHYSVSRKVMAVLGRRLRYLCEQMENLMVLDVTSRLARLIVYLSFDYLTNRDPDEGPVSFPVQLTQEDIAAMTGSCQQTVSEILKKLQQDGLIRVGRKVITITDPAEILRRIYP